MARTEITELWRRINKEFHDRFRDAFRELDLHPGSVFLLRRISQQPGETVSELARQVHLAKSHVSKMVDQLDRQGYVEKRPDRDDQRLVRVYLTEGATGLMAEMEARAEAAWNRVLAEIPEGQVAEVVRGLRSLLTALERSNRKEDDQA